MPTQGASGAEDNASGGTVDGSPFEFRLYGGPGAAVDDDAPSGSDPAAYAGVLIDIDSDPGDLTLRTDDPDDTDGNDPEDLYAQGFTLIGVDVDGDPGDLVGGFHVYKLVVDGSIGTGRDWNRYELQVSRDAARTDGDGVDLFAYEVTYAGRPDGPGAIFTDLRFVVPDTVTDEIDIQTLDLDHDNFMPLSQLTTRSAFFDDSQTFESGQQRAGSTWFWSSLNQPDGTPGGDGTTGLTYATAGEEGQIWVLDVDSIGNSSSASNPFSVRIRSAAGAELPMVFAPINLGQANTAAAGLTVNGDGTPGEPGPFFVGISQASGLDLAWNGPAHAALILLAGGRNTEGFAAGCVGRLAIGVPPTFSDVVIVFDGTRPTFPDALFRLDASGTATQSFAIPQLPSGPLVNHQGIVTQPSGCPAQLTAAFYVSLN